MMVLHSLALHMALLLLFLSPRAASAHSNYFIEPPAQGPDGNFSQDQTYSVGQTINVQWKSNYTAVSLVLFQEYNKTGTVVLQEQVPPPSARQWTVETTGFDLSQGKVFYFWIMNGSYSDSDGLFASHYFDIDNSSTAAASASSTSGSTTFVTATSAVIGNVTGPPSLNTSAAAPANGTSTAQSRHSSKDLSKNAKIGIGVGIGVGIPLSLLLALLAIRMRKRRVSQPPPAGRDSAKKHTDRAVTGECSSPEVEGSRVEAELPDRVEELAAGRGEAHELPEDER